MTWREINNNFDTLARRKNRGKLNKLRFYLIHFSVAILIAILATGTIFAVSVIIK